VAAAPAEASTGSTARPAASSFSTNAWAAAHTAWRRWKRATSSTRSNRSESGLPSLQPAGETCYFLGTDSAPHPIAKKLVVNGIPGVFNAPVAIETYAKVFEQEDALDKLEAFASLNGPRHYRLPPNEDTITLEKSAWTAPPEVEVEGPDEKSLIYRGGESIEWKVVSG
jgi:dihydroorotase